MQKIKVTAQQRANAIEARDVLWPNVPEDRVVSDLSTWYYAIDHHCGTHACFGGWCALHPPFIEQGLRRHHNWVNCVDPATNKLVSDSGDNFIFGDDNLFNPRGSHPADDFASEYGTTDHELVTNRLNWLIENSEVTDA